jgi:hypothetical protein
MPKRKPDPFLANLGYYHESEITGPARSIRTLRRMALKGDGPPRTRLGNAYYYQIDSFRAWLASKTEIDKKALPVRRRRRKVSR